MDAEINIKQIKEKATVLQNKIKSLLRGYEEDTGTIVTGIDVNRVSSIDGTNIIMDTPIKIQIEGL